MRTVWKFELQRERHQKIQAPSVGFNAIHVGTQDGTLQLWADVETEEGIGAIDVWLVGTGHEVPHAGIEYVGSIMDNFFVWHVYV